VGIVEYLDKQARRKSAEKLAEKLVNQLKTIAEMVYAELKNMGEDERSAFLSHLAELLGGTAEADSIIKSLFKVLDYILRRGE